MTKAIRIERTGGPEVMQYVDVQVGPPGPDEVQVRNHAVGLNYIDVYFRTGLYPMPLPAGIGLEGAGEVVAVGANVKSVKVGDRVAYSGQPPGSYAQLRNMPPNNLVKLPASISYETGAAMMLKGLTVQYLFRRTYKLQKGQTILFHAAAGGVGLIAMQWAKALGVTVIGTVGSEEKAALARKFGCDHTILYTRENVVERVREITNGEMVPVVYDSVGKDTFQASIDCLRPFGLMVSFGNASGPVPPMPLTALKGSLYITRPSLMAHTADRGVLDEMAADLFKMVSSGKVHIPIDQRYPLSEARQAHIDLEGRKTTGTTILLP
ncbi:MAG TPA: quinone oxidoreductase [Quisquiliibacterium sp.]|nr:quinone oxidoreductase [Quisquiliibacterium sp.]HPA90711.1 quinone oxidoreductase [Quisquiliibacterium sp.]HQD83305.1 quinone oxidoreductase [Quisquiliibacterium sp.]HQN11168.1 quinone oxidoreductase [Quisquiliibacterium sp.]HQP65274.1 quinone oxidoreductase [Quisquiliibacterium sp.]